MAASNVLSRLWPRSSMSSYVIPLQRLATHCSQRKHVTFYMRATHTLRARQETAMRVLLACRGCTLPASSYRRLSGAARSQRVKLNERWPAQRHPSSCGSLLATVVLCWLRLAPWLQSQSGYCPITIRRSHKRHSLLWPETQAQQICVTGQKLELHA